MIRKKFSGFLPSRQMNVRRMNRRFPAVTVKQIQKIDSRAIQECGIPAFALMENAGRVISAVVLSHVESFSKQRVCLFCGTGNNGGDGLVAARYLVNAGAKVVVYMLGRPAELRPDAAGQYKIFSQWGQRPVWVTEMTAGMGRDIDESDVIVDAIFGVGLNREIGGLQRAVIEGVNSSGKKVVAVDIPSGLDGTTGAIQGICIKATQTVTMSLPKKGFFRGAGPEVAGELLIADIGIPRKLLVQVCRKKF